MDDEDRRALARDLVKKAVARPGYSRARLAKDADLDPKTIRDFLAGRRWPQEETRAAISVALGWRPDEIDHIVQHGEPRATGGLFLHTRSWHKPLAERASVSADIDRLYLRAVGFGLAVRENFPEVSSEADDLLNRTTRLWAMVNEIYHADEVPPALDQAAYPVAALDDPANPPGAGDDDTA